jgi:hypothetical protein
MLSKRACDQWSQAQVQAQQMLLRPWSERRRRVDSHAGDQAWLARWDRAIEIFAASSGPRSLSHVVAFDPGPLPVQPVVRDLWSDHVLFAADRQQVEGLSRLGQAFMQLAQQQQEPHLMSLRLRQPYLS